MRRFNNTLLGGRAMNIFIRPIVISNITFNKFYALLHNTISLDSSTPSARTVQHKSFSGGGGLNKVWYSLLSAHKSQLASWQSWTKLLLLLLTPLLTNWLQITAAKKLRMITRCPFCLCFVSIFFPVVDGSFQP